MNFASSLLIAVLLLCGGCAAAQSVGAATDGKIEGKADVKAGQQMVQPAVQADGTEWFSYRNVYRTMIWFEKYSKPKNFIQQHYRIIPKDKAASLEGVKLTIRSASIQVDLPLDTYGRAVFPLLKAAYDENAELRLNRKADAYERKPWVSILTRSDGIYEVADLRTACEQALSYWRYVGDASWRDRKCTGVKFTYLLNAGQQLKFRRAGQGGSTSEITAETSSQSGGTGSTYKRIDFIFSQWPAQGQVISTVGPVEINGVFE